MIQIYKTNNSNYEFNGDAALHPLRADLSLTLNGAWVLDIEIAQGDDAADLFVQDAVLKIDTPRRSGQLYVLTDPVRTSWDTLSAQAYPVALWEGQHSLIMRDCRPTNCNGRDALRLMLAGCGADEKWTAVSDIEKTATAYYVRKNFIEALSGSDDNSFLQRWGGELDFDNYKIMAMQNIGQDRGFTISASKNLAGFTVSEDSSTYADIVIPVAYGGRTSPDEVIRENPGRLLHKKFVEYPWIKLAQDATDDEEESVIVCQTENDLREALNKAAKDDFEAGAFDLALSYELDFIDLQQYDGYEDYKDLLSVWLGDKVRVENIDWRITHTQEVIGLTYDMVAGEITKLVLGSRPADFFSATSAAVSAIQTVTKQGAGGTQLVADRVSGVIDLLQTSLRAQRSVSEKAESRSILFEDTDPASPTYGAMSIGTQGLCITKKMVNGAWDWDGSTAIDANTVYADHIIAGLLSSKNGNFYFDLDTGRFELGSGTFKGTIKTAYDAEIGSTLTLDYDAGSFSGVFLGGLTAQTPALVLNADTDGSTNATVYTGGVLHPDAGYMRISQDASNRSLFTIQANGIHVQSGSKSGTGVTYEGSVKTIETVAGLVTKVGG